MNLKSLYGMIGLEDDLQTQLVRELTSNFQIEALYMWSKHETEYPSLQTYCLKVNISSF
jgi:hypothetical protein